MGNNLRLYQPTATFPLAAVTQEEGLLLPRLPILQFRKEETVASSAIETLAKRANTYLGLGALFDSHCFKPFICLNSLHLQRTH